MLAEAVGCGVNSIPNPPYIPGVQNFEYVWLGFHTGSHLGPGCLAATRHDAGHFSFFHTRLLPAS